MCMYIYIYIHIHIHMCIYIYIYTVVWTGCGRDNNTVLLNARQCSGYML